jgi:type I restriction enzyme, R subunit
MREKKEDKKKKKIAQMEETDIAVFVSQTQNEIEDMKKKGIGILPHRTRIVHEDLAEKFKDPDDGPGMYRRDP